MIPLTTPSSSPPKKKILSSMQANELYREGKILFDTGRYGEAADPLRRAAESGNADAQNDYAFLCKKGRGVARDPGLAESWYQKAAEQGHEEGCHNLAVLLIERDAESGIAPALSWLKVNAGQGYALSQLQLAHMYRKGNGVDADLTEALRLFGTAADQGNDDATFMVNVATRYGATDHRGPYPSFTDCETRANEGNAAASRLLGAYLMLGFGCTADPNAARASLERAAEGGDAPGIRALGSFIFDDDPVGAVAKWETAVAAGDAYAKYLLAKSLLDGEGVALDPPRALQLLEAAADKGIVDALVVISDHYRVGDVIPQDMALAVQWGKRAAQAGHRETQYTLGVILANGIGVPADVAMGLHWIETAASKGWPDAQCNLGVRYLQGDGVEQDLKQGAKWVRAAAEQNHPNAIYSLGVCYRNGEGLPADPEFGTHCWRKAAALGHSGAIAALAQLGPDDANPPSHPKPQPEPVATPVSVAKPEPVVAAVPASAAPVDTSLQQLTANLVTQQVGSQGCVEAAMLLGVFWIATWFVDPISGFTASAGWTALGMFVLGVFIGPSEKEMGDRKEGIEQLANISSAKNVTVAVFLLMGLGVTVFSDDLYAWGKERVASSGSVTGNEEPSTSESKIPPVAAPPKTTEPTPKPGPERALDIPVGSPASIFAVARFSDKVRITTEASYILASWDYQSRVIEIPFRAAEKASSEAFAKLDKLSSLRVLSPTLSRLDIAAIETWRKKLSSSWYNSPGPTGRRKIETSIGPERPFGIGDPARTYVVFFWTRSSAEKYREERAIPVRPVSAPPNLMR